MARKKKEKHKLTGKASTYGKHFSFKISPKLNDLIIEIGNSKTKFNSNENLRVKYDFFFFILCIYHYDLLVINDMFILAMTIVIANT
jgi:hypothetical protein